jgi:hypothetical protein
VREAILQGSLRYLGSAMQAAWRDLLVLFPQEVLFVVVSSSSLILAAASVNRKLEICGLGHTEVGGLRMLVQERRQWKHLQNQ